MGPAPALSRGSRRHRFAVNRFTAPISMGASGQASRECRAARYAVRAPGVIETSPADVADRVR